MTEKEISEKDMVPVEEASEEVQEEARSVESILEERGMDWTPKTDLGRRVVNGEITSMGDIFAKGHSILEEEIVDYLLPNLEHEIILIGGTPGKGGGIRRTPGRRTSRMHKSGRRQKTSCLVVCGNKDGYVGIGLGKAVEFRAAIEKALKNAKLNIAPVQRGCGSWECACGGHHSIPATVEGKEGSVSVVLKPAPKGIGLAVSDEVKKLMQHAGIRDMWIKSYGSTSTRINHIRSVMSALMNLNSMKIPDDVKEKTGVVVG